MAFLLDPNITSTDIYTTLSSLWIEHDQVTVQWEQSDLPGLPTGVATLYESIMRSHESDMPMSTVLDSLMLLDIVTGNTPSADETLNISQAVPAVRTPPLRATSTTVIQDAESAIS